LEGWEVMFIYVMIDIGCQLVINISLGTGAEELGFGLKVVKMMSWGFVSVVEKVKIM
jgi:hypothetical protein